MFSSSPQQGSQAGLSAKSGPGLPLNRAARSAAPAATTNSVAPAAQSAAADPAYLAYLRGAGVEEAELNNVLGTRVGALTRSIGRALPAYADKRAEAIEGAGNAAESRGFFRSGQRMTNQFRAGRDVDRERMNFEAETRDKMADLYGTNALDIARIRREMIERGITGAQDVAITNAEAGIY